MADGTHAAAPRKPPSRKIASEARAFRIWREGQAVNWQCTVRDLHEATGINAHTIYSICARRGWKPLDEDGAAQLKQITGEQLGSRTRAADSLIAQGIPISRHHFEDQDE